MRLLKGGENLAFQVTTTINNLVIGRVYCHHHGTMNIIGNKEYSCKLTFKQQTFLERNPRQVLSHLTACLHFCGPSKI
jgi:hypothetical protein